MTVDPELVTRKLVLIAHDLEAIRGIHGAGPDAYLRSELAQAAAERHLERMIGRMVDVNYHLLTGSGHPPPSDYYGSFVQLGTAGILAPDFARRLAASAGLRNRIVHEYDELDQEKIFAALATALEHVPVYVRDVEQHLTRS
jgi:uncharacterized protein YutE (UPF0331/DUF86 family)